VKARGAGIIDAHIGFERAPHNHLIAVERDGNGEQLAAQENKRRATISPATGNFQSVFIEVFAQLGSTGQRRTSGARSRNDAPQA
jgi:hypothetical protein